MVLTPAYGRDYKSKKEIETDFNNDKDFVIADFSPDCGRYVNRPQLVGKVKTVQVRYKNLQNVTVITVK